MNDNKRIAFNTLAIYFRLIVTTLVSLLTSRYVLIALGHSDFGLYNVVGSTIALINTLGIAMHTTTRRYINVEMGKGEDGNLNKIFNISLVLHIVIAIIFFVFAMAIGYWYIYNFLNVDAEKVSDAFFVYIISTIVACIGLVNVPYQGLMNAFQKFWQVAAIDIFNTLLKLVFVLILLNYNGNRLRFYAIAMSMLTLISFIAYHVLCKWQWNDVVRYKRYHESKLYKEILVFNNYTAMGAVSCMGRTQGSQMVINYFFGTIVNAALSIAFQVQTFTSLFATNLAQASAPQLTQAYSAGDFERAYNLCSKVARYTILIMCCIFFPLTVGLKQILVLWLVDIPEHTLVLTRWVLITSLVSTFGANLSTYVHASGKVKWFQILGSILEISVIPISIILYLLDFPPVTIIVVLAMITFTNTILSLLLLKRLDRFPSTKYAKDTYIKPFTVIAVMGVFVFVASSMIEDSLLLSMLGIALTLIITFALCVIVGLTSKERHLMFNAILNRINNRNKQS